MKKKIIILLIIGILLIMLTPIRNKLKDGGSIEYKSLIYKITHLKVLNENYENGYKEGITVEIFGKKIYENITSKEIQLNELIVYEQYDGKPYNPNTYCCKTDKIFKRIKTETKDAKILDISKNDKYILISDGTTKIYNIETEELIKLSLEPNFEIYVLGTIGEEDKLIGITYYKYKDYQNYNGAGFYNIEKKTKLYDMKYNVINVIDEETLEAVKKEQTKKYTLSTKEEIIFKEEIVER